MLIVVAGMEGALPSVVAGLVAAPVIAVPTSIGYGASFGGMAALLAMLNSCAPGVAVGEHRQRVRRRLPRRGREPADPRRRTGGPAAPPRAFFMGPDPVATHLAPLERWIAQFPSAIVAYSGGVDSALVAAVAHRALGDRALACIGVSPIYPEREMRDAVALAERLGVPYRLVETEKVTFSMDGSVGGAFEELYGQDPTSDGAFRLGQSLSFKLSQNAKLTQGAWGLWTSTAFQPNWRSMKGVVQPHLAATISTGGAAKWVNVPPTEMLAQRVPGSRSAAASSVGGERRCATAPGPR